MTNSWQQSKRRFRLRLWDTRLRSSHTRICQFMALIASNRQVDKWPKRQRTSHSQSQLFALERMEDGAGAGETDGWWILLLHSFLSFLMVWQANTSDTHSFSYFSSALLPALCFTSDFWVSMTFKTCMNIMKFKTRHDKARTRL